MELREYQLKEVEAVFNSFREGNNALIVAATGTGKTIVLSEVTKRLVADHKRVLILAHRSELLSQTQEKLLRFGVMSSLEKAQNTATVYDNVVVASIQSLAKPERLNRFEPDHFDVIIVDECHHIMSDTYQRVIGYFSNALILGVTATPNRSDMKPLSEIFPEISFSYNTRDAIDDGYLVPINIKRCPIKIDLSDVRTSAGDYLASDLDKVLDPYLVEIANVLHTEAEHKKTLIFTPTIAIADKMAKILRESGFTAESVNGKTKDRESIINDFSTGAIQIMTNPLLFCLDTETEVLTRRGFLKYNELNKDDFVANWNIDNSVFFKKPKNIILRPLDESEYMISVESQMNNFRVSNKHNMVFYNKEKDCYIKNTADTITTRSIFPTCGVETPERKIFFENIEYTPSKRDISSNKYNLIHKEGYGEAEATEEAVRRLTRKHTLRHLNPHELSLAQCKLIGFWIADGSKNELSSGGIEYTFSQSLRYSNIIKWIDKVLEECGYDYLKKYFKRNNEDGLPRYRWHLSRGTGSGSQERYGVYDIEPYLDKSGSELWWYFNEEQFDAFLEGLWYGDGNHGNAENGFPKSIHITATDRKPLDFIMAIACTRGWKTQIHDVIVEKDNCKNQKGLTLTKGQKRYLSSKTIINNESFSDENVWCVTVDSGNIITRRKGIVTVMGNCEGFDEPTVECIVNLRATKSRSLFQQILGRGLRLSPGKESLLYLDFLWNSAKKDKQVLNPATLLIDEKDSAFLKDKDLNEEIDIFDLEEKLIERRLKAEEKLAEDLKRAARNRFLPYGIRFTEIENEHLSYFYEEDGESLLLTSLVYKDDPFIKFVTGKDSFEWVPFNRSDCDPATSRQLETLRNLGFAHPEIIQFKGQASEIINAAINRRKKNLCSFKQFTLLDKRGFRNVRNWTPAQCGYVIDAMAKNKWKVPSNFYPIQFYKPKKEEQ